MLMWERFSMVAQKLVDYAKVVMEEAFSRRHEEVAPKPPLAW